MFNPLRLAVYFQLGVSVCVAAEPSALEFNRDIRPILADHCFACHGPDQNKRQADLRLDTERGLFEGEAPPVVRDHSRSSPMLQRVSSLDSDQRMPPPDFGKDLSPEQIQRLERWIEQGAPWQGHWAFQPITRPVPPDSMGLFPAETTQPPQAVDAFVLAELDAHGLQLSAPAERRTLARRLHFDLTGLPPTLDVVERFVESDDPLAYEQMVDELLASPNFGERMAMWWLDLVRYADSVGYHGDQPVSVSPYRDYVIAAFNNNLPFDRFTVEQLAGDLLPEPSREQLIAAGYNRLGMMSAEGGVQPKEYLAKYIAERVRNLGGTWLGVTLGCCECHDHKYDPFTTRDFYQFEAFFADIEERGLYSGDDWGPKMAVPNDEQQAQLAQLDHDIASQEQLLDKPTEQLAKAQLNWEADQTPWLILEPKTFESAAGTTLTRQPDNSILASGPTPDIDTYTITIDQFPASITALRIDALTDESLPQKGPGRANNGNFVLSEFELHLLSGEQVTPIALQNASATYEQNGAAESHPDRKWSAASAIDGDTRGTTWGWAVMEQVGQSNSAVFEVAPDNKLAARIESDSGAKLQIVLKQQVDNPQHTLGRVRLLATSAPRPIAAQPWLPEEQREILAIDRPLRTQEQVDKLAFYYRQIAPELAAARERLKQLQATREQIVKSVPTMLVTKIVEPRMVRVLARGNWMDDNGTEVKPTIPALLGGERFTSANSPQFSPSEGKPQGDRRMNRLDLANWVVAPENPLTARVAVNRFWKLFFGTGLSAKLDDLGAQGESPSHPLLLDWLADEFRSSGWNVKHMIKLMVMSDTYQQSSLADEGIQVQDPYNRLLSHQGRWRLDAEVVRDTMLASSGLLENTLGGQSVRPYQPPGYWAYLNFPQRQWDNGKGAELYRRGLYTHWQRQYLHPSLLAFDAPSREECTADRPRSNTPLQALVLLNDPTYVEAAKALALRTLRSVPVSPQLKAEAGDENHAADTARIDWAIRHALVRPPRPREIPILLELLEKHRREFAQDVASAKQLLDVGDFRISSDGDAIDGTTIDGKTVELAAWTSVARTLLNLHETITRN